MRRNIILISMLAALVFGTVEVDRTVAQDASPVAADCVAPELPPGTPTPLEASPIAGPEGEGEEGAPPAAPENGVPADEATSEIYIAAIQNLVNCLNSGDYLGVAALSTESFRVNFLAGSNPYDTPIVFEDAEQLDVLNATNVLTYADGSASVDFTYGGFFAGPTAISAERWYFVQEDGVVKINNITPIAVSADVLPGAVVVEVTMVDYAFAIEPRTIAAGTPVIFRISNQMESTTGHVAALVTYPEGTTAEQIITGEIDAMEASTGFFNAVYLEPGDTGDMAFTSLDAGTYFLVCDVETESGHAHFVLGMATQLIVE